MVQLGLVRVCPATSIRNSILKDSEYRSGVEETNFHTMMLYSSPGSSRHKGPSTRAILRTNQRTIRCTIWCPLFFLFSFNVRLTIVMGVSRRIGSLSSLPENRVDGH
jgi:hypothetical protein